MHARSNAPADDAMSAHRPSTVDNALAVLADAPHLVPVAGGTDVMVAVNFGHLRPRGIMSVGHLTELRGIDTGTRVWCGAAAPYTTVLDTLGATTPALDQAVRTIGSPQIRNAGTIGGNLGTCSPAGDILPVLSALDATVHVRSQRGGRDIPMHDWMVAPKRSVRDADELIVGVAWRRPEGSQIFMKAGTRNAMVIAIASLAMVVDRSQRRVRVALGSVAPRIMRATDAERFAVGLYEEGGWDRPLRLSEATAARFADLTAAACSPIDDVRATAAYRRHVVGVMAGRALRRTGTAP